MLGCSSAPKQWELEVNRMHDESLIVETESVIANEMTTSEYLNRYVEEVCHLSTNLEENTPEQNQECDTKLAITWRARLEARYFLADNLWLQKMCKMHPIDCKNPQIEQWARESHNTNLEQSRKQRLSQGRQAEGQSEFVAQYQIKSLSTHMNSLNQKLINRERSGNEK